jgi:HSP20 family protein
LSNPWWRRRKKKDPWFTDIYDELERLGELIDETMQKAFENFKDTQTKRNRFEGFSVRIFPDRKPRIREFENRQPLQAKSEISDDLEPLVDIIEGEEMVNVLVALPGINKDDIDLRLTESSLTFYVDAADFEWCDKFKLPARVDPKSASASYKQGILEVKMKKLEKISRTGRTSLKK